MTTAHAPVWQRSPIRPGGIAGITRVATCLRHPSRSDRPPDPSLAAKSIGPDDTTKTYPVVGGAKLQRRLLARRRKLAQPIAWDRAHPLVEIVTPSSVDYLSSLGKLTGHGYGPRGSVVSASSTQAREVPWMLAICTGVRCSTRSWQRCPPGPAAVWAAVSVLRLRADRARPGCTIVPAYDSAPGRCLACPSPAGA
jgi:hypothetical protein